MAANYKISREIDYKVSVTDTKNHTKDFPLPGFPPTIQRSIIDPESFEHGFKKLRQTVREFIDISSGYNTNDLYIYSTIPFYVKITNSDIVDDYSIIETSIYQYQNKNNKLKFSVANGTLDYDPSSKAFSANESSVDQEIFFVNIEEF